MSRFLIVACALAAVVPIRAAQVASPSIPAQQNGGTVAGRVLDATSKKALENAIVVMRDEKSAMFDSLRTNADGSFTFRSVPPGTWTINTTKSGYIPTTNARPLRVMLASAQHVSGLLVALRRYSAIGGTVRDENGEPVVGAIMRTFSKGTNGWSVQLSTSTDDRGMYRFTVGSGEFVVSAMPFEKPTASKPALYPLHFYPGTTSLDAAQRLIVGAGQQVEGIDFSIAPVSAVSVSGVVADQAGPAAGLPVSLTPAESDQFNIVPNAISAKTDNAGRFTFPLVPPGQYRLRARRTLNAPPRSTDGSLVSTGSETIRVSTTETPPVATLPIDEIVWADVPVTVAADPIAGVLVDLHQGHHVRGRVEFVGATPAPAPDQVARLPINIWNPLRKNQNYAPAKFDATGQFATNALDDGPWVLNIVPPAPWVVQSIRLAGRDVTDTAIPVEDRDVSDVVITLSDRGATVAGTVRQADGTADGGARVVLFPVDPRLRSTTTGRRIKQANTATNGTFRLGPLMTGDYWIAAVSVDQPSNLSAEALQALAIVATRISVAEGSAKQVDLRTIESIAKGRDLGDSCGEDVDVGSITGIVLADDEHGSPLRDVVMTLSNLDGIAVRTTVTNAAGAFAFADLSPGRFRLTASKKTFLTSDYGAARPGRAGTPISLADGQQVNVSMKLTHGAVIAGTVTGKNGDPIRWAEVHILTTRTDNGRTTVSLVQAETALAPTETPADAFTDEEGRYRFYGLPAGTYLVGVTAGPGGASVPARSQTDTNSNVVPPLTVYAQTFFPSATDVSMASPITLHAGEERTSVDVQMPLLPSASVRGTVVRQDGSKVANARVSIFPSRPYIPDAGAIIGSPGGARALGGFTSVLTTADGQFHIDSVTSDAYTMYAIGSAVGSTSRTLWAKGSFAVDGDDRNDLVLTLAPPMIVSGHLTLAGATAQADFSSTRINLTSVSTSGLAVSVPDVRVDATGAFVVRNVMPGDYQLSVAGLSDRWQAMSAPSQGKDALDFPITIDPAADLGELTINLSDRPAQLSGTFSDTDNRPVTDYTVVLLPANSEYWQPLSRRIQALRVDTNGHFLFRAVPPGEYLVAAVSDAEPTEWRDRAFLESVSKTAIRVTIVEGQQKIQNLRLRSQF